MTSSSPLEIFFIKCILLLPEIMMYLAILCVGVWAVMGSFFAFFAKIFFDEPETSFWSYFWNWPRWIL